MKQEGKQHHFVLQRFLISSTILAGLAIGVSVTANADTTQEDPKPVEASGQTSESSIIQGKTTVLVAPQDSQSADTQIKSSHPITVIPKKDNTVHLKNQLVISTSKTPSLNKVTASDGKYDEKNNLATLNDPTSDSQLKAEYGQVGTYQGKAITAEVTIDHIKLHSTDHVTPSVKLADGSKVSVLPNQAVVIFGKSFGEGIDTYNVAEDELHVIFRDAQGNVINISGDGYITVGSLNGPTNKIAGNEYVDYTSSPSEAAYVTEDTVVQAMDNPNGGSTVVFAGKSSDFKDVLGAPTSENGAVTFTLNGSELTFLNGTSRHSVTGDAHWNHTVLTLSSATVAPAVLPAPVLSVDKSSAKADDQVTYTLTQAVNTLGQDTLLRYTSWDQTVQLPTEADYQGVQVLDSTGQQITSAVSSYDATTHQLKVSLSNEYLANTMLMNGESYQLKISTKVSKNVTNGEVGQATGASVIDTQSALSNGVDVMYIAPVTVVPVKTQVITIYDTDNRGNVFNIRTIKGNVGDNYTIKPLKTDVKQLMYLDSSSSLNGVFNNDKDKKVTLLYGRTFQKVVTNKTGYTSLLTYNGNDELILDDQTLPDGNALEITYNPQTHNANVIWTNAKGQVMGRRNGISSNDSFAMKNNGRVLRVNLNSGQMPIVKVSGFKDEKNTSDSGSNQPGRFSNESGTKSYIVNAETLVSSTTNKKQGAVDNDGYQLPQTAENSHSLAQLIGLALLGLMSVIGFGGKKYEEK